MTLIYIFPRAHRFWVYFHLLWFCRTISTVLLMVAIPTQHPQHRHNHHRITISQVRYCLPILFMLRSWGLGMLRVHIAEVFTWAARYNSLTCIVWFYPVYSSIHLCCSTVLYSSLVLLLVINSNRYWFSQICEYLVLHVNTWSNKIVNIVYFHDARPDN